MAWVETVNQSYYVKWKMNWVGGALYPVPTVCCPGGQDKPGVGDCPGGQDKPGGGDILPQGKVSLGTRYRTRNYYPYKLF